MNKDKIIELIERIQDYCRSMRCEECKFFSADRSCFKCDIRDFTRLFYGGPHDWNIEKIKERL